MGDLISCLVRVPEPCRHPTSDRIHHKALRSSIDCAFCFFNCYLEIEYHSDNIEKVKKSGVSIPGVFAPALYHFINQGVFVGLFFVYVFFDQDFVALFYLKNVQFGSNIIAVV